MRFYSFYELRHVGIVNQYSDDYIIDYGFITALVNHITDETVVRIPHFINLSRSL